MKSRKSAVHKDQASRFYGKGYCLGNLHRQSQSRTWRASQARKCICSFSSGRRNSRGRGK